MSASGGGTTGSRRRRGLGALFTTLLQPGSSSGAAARQSQQQQQQQQQAAVDAEEDERRLQRLAKNRESAQRSRQRKKEYLELLQERVHQTNATLEGLRRAHVAEGAPRLAEARAGFLEDCALARDDGTGPGMDEEDVEAFLRAFGPWAEERRALLTHDCERLKGVVLPPPARFWAWLAQQPDAFFTAATEGTPSPSSASASASASAAAASSSTTSSSTAAAAASAAKAGERLMQDGAASCGAGAELWPLLCFELQLKPEQEAALRQMGGGKARRGAAAAELGEVAATLAEVDVLEAELQGAARLLEAKLRALHRVLTPAQAVALEQALASS